MLAFECDYLEGAHEKILQRLVESNYEKVPGYGNDVYCEIAKAKIKECLFPYRRNPDQCDCD